MWGRRVTHWHTLHDSEACSTWTETPWRCCQVPRDGPQKPTNSFHPHSRPNIHHLITPLHLCGRIQKTSPEAEQETLGRTMRRTLPGAKEPRTSGTWSSLRHKEESEDSCDGPMGKAINLLSANTRSAGGRL